MKSKFQTSAIIAFVGITLAWVPGRRASAQDFNTLLYLSGSGGLPNDDGANPQGGLILSNGTLYGTTSYGGDSASGSVFSVNADGTGFRAIYSIPGGSYGQGPQGSPALSGNTLFGTTQYGGKTGGNLGVSGNGTVFKVNTDGSGFTNVHTFGPESPNYTLEVYTNADGMFPQGGVIVSGSTLYGTTQYGGSNGSGTVFAVNSDGSNFKVLHAFNVLVQSYYGGNTNSDGAQAAAGLVLSGNTLYGTTSAGGTNGSGTVFAVNTDGSGFTNLHTLVKATDGATPLAGLILSGGTLYGTAQSGGTNGSGTLFALSTNGTGFTNLYSFSASAYNSDSLLTNHDGANPWAGLFLSGSTLYGTAGFGGTNGYGTAFAVNTNGSGFTNLYSFTGGDDGIIAVGESFAFVSSGAFVLSGNTLYGAAPGGGSNGNGTIFGLAINGSGVSNVYTFSGYFTNGSGSDAASGLLLSGNTLYGTTAQGGNGYGTVFGINTDGSGYSILYNFTGGTDGAYPMAGLVLSGNTLFGTASGGGTNSAGVVFAIKTDGSVFSNLHSFGSLINDGTMPTAGLVLSGNTLYGTASQGGTNSFGSVFSIKTDGSGYSNLYDFSGFSGTDGANPMAGLVVSGNTLYGTASQGGSNFSGSVFSIKTNGTGFSNLYSFAGGFGPPSTDGANPMAGLLLAGNTLYGTTEYGGTNGYGTVFAVNTDGSVYTNLYGFAGGAQGAGPVAGLTLSGNALYGTTSGADATGYGTVFGINTDGSGFTNVYSFADGLDGAYPQGGLVLSGNTFYGTTRATVFSLSLGPAVILAQPTITSANFSGTTLTINGTNGQSGGVYKTLTSTNITLPVNLWTPVATNVLNATGNFSFMVTNASNGTNRQQFFLIQESP